jgi:murein DD-endopeptidase MepM/ murein hydrolase activator NlpD
LPAVAFLLAGCSADIGRFDTASLAESNSPTPSASVTQPAGTRSNLVGGNGYGSVEAQGQASPGGTYSPPPSNQPAPSRFTDLPPPSGASSPPAYGAPRVPPAEPKVAVLPQRGEAIEVATGDTLYGIARRHNVSMSEIMALNDLKNPALKPGQQLYLPAGGHVKKPLARANTDETAAIPASAAPPGWTGSHTVKSGESLYGIARQHNVKVAELQSANSITDARRVKPGTVLRVPSGSGGPSETERAPAPPATSARSGAPSAQPVILNSEEKSRDTRVAELNKPNTATDAPAAGAPGSGSVAGSGKLRWPVEGKVISAFGPRPDGTHNDGVNLAVPMGSDVHAAEAGVVAYAGSELKGYGNLVLLRHDNGWVTAYAHGDELLVKRGDKVKRGQVIAKAGRTGQVDQPQVHFELRQGQRPVDPTPFMERM